MTKDEKMLSRLLKQRNEINAKITSMTKRVLVPGLLLRGRGTRLRTAEAELSRLRSTAGEGLPPGCPDVRHWHPKYGFHLEGYQYEIDKDGSTCSRGECFSVEIHPVGTRARLEELQGGVK